MENEKKYKDREWLEREYIENKRTAKDIGKECGVSDETILSSLKHFEIKRRNSSEAQFKNLNAFIYLQDKDWLYRRYIIENKSTVEIGKELDCGSKVVNTWLRFHNIPIRTINGKNNPNWKGGITCLYDKIRTCIKNKEWRKQVFKRDFYKCIFCDSKQDLEVDHKKPFALIMEENN